MSIKIVYKGFAQPMSAAESIALLAKVFNGDKAKAEEAFITPNYVLRTVASKAEIGLILPRLEKLGLLCEVVEQSQASSGTFDDHEVTTRMVACKFCGYEQALAKTCRKCGQSFAAVKKINWKPAVDLEREEAVDAGADEEKPNVLINWFHQSPIFAPRNLVIVLVILGVLVGAGFLSVPGVQEEQATSSKNPVLMLIKGIVTSDGNEVAKTAVYNPESGENPYANKLKSLGIDQKEFSKAAAGIDGPISGAEVQGIIDKNEMLKNAIDDAVKSSAHSQGNTEADQAINSIDTPESSPESNVADKQIDEAIDAVQ